MANTDYTKQTATEPVFADMLWSKPQTKRTAGKLLIVGGNAHGISSPLQAYELATEAGVGHARVFLPDALKPMVGQIFEQGDYAPSTPSGSLSKRALAELLDVSKWADVNLLAGDLGRNSETAVLIENFMSKTIDKIVATKDAADYIIGAPAMITPESNLLLVVSLAQLQKYIKQRNHEQAVTFDMNLPQLIAVLEEVSDEANISIITKHHDNILLAQKGLISVTQDKKLTDKWRLRIATYASVWMAQQPTKLFEATTTAIWHALQEPDVVLP